MGRCTRRAGGRPVRCRSRPGRRRPRGGWPARAGASARRDGEPTSADPWFWFSHWALAGSGGSGVPQRKLDRHLYRHGRLDRGSGGRAMKSPYRDQPIAAGEDPVIGCVFIRDTRFFAVGGRLICRVTSRRRSFRARGMTLPPIWGRLTSMSWYSGCSGIASRWIFPSRGIAPGQCSAIRGWRLGGLGSRLSKESCSPRTASVARSPAVGSARPSRQRTFDGRQGRRAPSRQRAAAAVRRARHVRPWIPGRRSEPSAHGQPATPCGLR